MPHSGSSTVGIKEAAAARLRHPPFWCLGANMSRLYTCLCLLALALSCYALQPRRRSQFSILNKKIDTVKQTLEAELKDLVFEITTLYSRVEEGSLLLEEHLNTSNTESGTVVHEVWTGDNRSSADTSIIQRLETKIVDQSDEIQQLQTKLETGREERTRLLLQLNTMTQEIQHLRESGQQMKEALQTETASIETTLKTLKVQQQQNLTSDTVLEKRLASHEDDILMLTEAFRAEKYVTRRFKAQMEEQSKQFEENKDQLETISSHISQLNTTLTSLATDVVNLGEPPVSEKLQAAVDEHTVMLEELRNTTQNLDTQAKEANAAFLTLLALESRQLNSSLMNLAESVNEMRTCCRGGSSGVQATRVPPLMTSLATFSFDVLPKYGEDLYNAIHVGARVVRGPDWSWGSQDGDPPGPGTVIQWMSNSKSTRQVIVRWDAGRQANYRVGAYGKYDLYLLADQSPPV